MFGQQGSGELLLGGRGGFEGSVSSNGFGSETNTASNPSAPAPGQSGSSAFDLSDFPSLGGSSAGSAGGDNNSLANALRQQQMMAQQQLMQGQNSGKGGNSFSRLGLGTSMANALGSSGSNGANFNMATEDFPALPGAPLGGGSGNSGSGLLGEVGGSGSSRLGFGGAPTPSISRAASGASGGIFGGDFDGLSNQFDASSLLSGGGNQNSSSSGSNPVSQQRSSTASAPTGASASNASNAGSALSGEYGLLGLLKFIRLSEEERNSLAVGSDLSQLGLNLNSSENLYSKFASPWSESPATKEPQYQLPMCYYMQPPALKTGHLSKFQLETLFYIFYALPKDVLQAYAAQELYSREWKFHTELKLWFKRTQPSEGGQFVYFDIQSWERRLFNGNMDQNITLHLMPEDDIRVKFTSS